MLKGCDQKRRRLGLHRPQEEATRILTLRPIARFRSRSFATNALLKVSAAAEVEFPQMKAHPPEKRAALAKMGPAKIEGTVREDPVPSS